MFIERNNTLSPVKDFMKNVKPKLRDLDVPVEVYNQNILIGWNISTIDIPNMNFVRVSKI